MNEEIVVIAGAFLVAVGYVVVRFFTVHRGQECEEIRVKLQSTLDHSITISRDDIILIHESATNQVLDELSRERAAKMIRMLIGNGISPAEFISIRKRWIIAGQPDKLIME